MISGKLQRSVGFVLFLLLPPCDVALSQPQELVDQFERRSYTLDGFTLKYRLFVPGEYDPMQPYPVVLALHGSGERGDDNERHIASHRMATAWADPATQARHPSFVVAPQAPSGGTWNSSSPDAPIRPELATTFAILDSLSVEFNIDPDRVYITGLSLGGFGTYEAVARTGDRNLFAAAIPMSGGWDPMFASNLGNVPFWIVHGESDPVVPAAWDKEIVFALEQLGTDALYTNCGPYTCVQLSNAELDAALAAHPSLIYSGFPGQGHGPWDQWYNDVKLQDWLFAQHRLLERAIDIETPVAADPMDEAPTAIHWSAPNPDDTIELWFQRSPDEQWTLIDADVENDGAFGLDTHGLPDSPLARVRLFLIDHDGFIYARSESDTFPIDAEGNGAPYARLFDFPFRSGEELADTLLTLQYRAVDVESDNLTAILLYSGDGGASFARIESFDLASSTTIRDVDVNLEALPNSPTAVLQLEIADDISKSFDQSPVFRKQTPRFSTDQFDHTMGASGATIVVSFVSVPDLSGHRYRVTFNIQDDGTKTYSVRDLDLDQKILSDLPVSRAESPVFDGIRLLINDLTRATVNRELSGWNNPSVTVGVNVTAPSVNIGGGSRDLLATPDDYSLSIASDAIDTSSTLFGFPAKEMRFTVENVTEGGLRDVLFADPNGDGYPNVGETLYIVEQDPNAEPFPAWLLSFTGFGEVVPPVPGDAFLLVTRKPVTSSDVFEFVGMVPVSTESSDLPEGFSLSQNYPNPLSSRTTIRYTLPTTQRVRFSLHDALGRTVRELLNTQVAAGEHSLTIDSRTLASGVYFYRMDAGSVVETRKMLVVH
ncbi:MAG: T9SS type A sorting domain-containing protein [Rhodothermales bacterium]